MQMLTVHIPKKVLIPLTKFHDLEGFWAEHCEQLLCHDVSCKVCSFWKPDVLSWEYAFHLHVLMGALHWQHDVHDIFKSWSVPARMYTVEISRSLHTALSSGKVRSFLPWFESQQFPRAFCQAMLDFCGVISTHFYFTIITWWYILLLHCHDLIVTYYYESMIVYHYAYACTHYHNFITTL